MVTSSDHSSSSSEEYSDTSKPEMKSSADARADVAQYLSDAGKLINYMPLDHLKVSRDWLSKREAEVEKLADYQKRRRIQQTKLAAEDEIQSRANNVSSDSDAEEIESIWNPRERRIRPYPPGRETERLAEADFRAECEEDDYLDAMYGDPEDQLEEVPNKNSDNEEELKEGSMEDDDHEDDESDESDD
ncbi:glutamic acid-rich protein-like [Papaver somniferum]|uniref:glutamic acid-rich protein-like n=1 Tax=Papaver somniferum TaxID=3469 RepID=UPI000E70556F|nr:glutamic acid-rich protein-like [Papaver somniferum]